MWILSLPFVATVWGASFTMQTTRCPVGNDQVRVYSVVSDNQLGGFDSDLASYSSGEQARQHLISTCSNNFVSLYGTDISRVIAEDIGLQIVNQTDQTRQVFSNPEDPTIWERYLLAIEAYKILGESELFIAKLHMQAIWSARDTIVGYHPGLDGPEVIDKILAQADAELGKPLSSDQHKILIFNLARVSHRGGYSQQRDDYIARFLSLPNLTKDEISAAKEFKFISQNVEPKLQIRIQNILTPSVIGKLSSEEKAKAHYLLGDIARRQLEPQKAQKHYQAVLLEDKPEEKISTLANYFINKM